MTSLETLLKEGTKVLEQHKIQEARLDAWLLLEHVTGMNRAFYFAHSADGIEEEKADRYRELIRMYWFRGRIRRHWWRRLWKS